MKKPQVKEISRIASCKLQGQVDALEFLLAVKTEAIIRDQARMAELAVVALDHGVWLEHVFADNDVVEHVMRCIQAHDPIGFKRHFPNGFAAPNPRVDLAGASPAQVLRAVGQTESQETNQ